MSEGALVHDFPRLLAEKSLVLTGGSAEERAQATDSAQSGFKTVFRLKEHASSFAKVLASARQVLPIKGATTDDQAWDLLLDWSAGYQEALVVLPEAQALVKNDMPMLIELVSAFMTQSYRLKKQKLRLLLTSKAAIPNLADRVRLFLGDPVSPRAVFDRHFRVLELAS